MVFYTIYNIKNMTEQYIKKQKPSQKEKNKNVLFSDVKLTEKEQEAIYNQYFQNLSTWHQYAKEFIDSPFTIDGKKDSFVIDMKKLSSNKKAKLISAIVKYPHQMDEFYAKARIDMYKKHHFKNTNCASYAGFVSTFSKLLNPKNDVVVHFGSVIITKSLTKEEINHYADHFWVTVNGKLFDNSNIDDYSYTNYESILEIKDILSGNFEFE
jgi:hypothetical protein